jgi:hypothetical protein
MGTYNERPQVHPAITEQEPYITGNPKPTCCAADGDRGTSVGIDFEDRIRRYRKHRSVYTGWYC